MNEFLTPELLKLLIEVVITVVVLVITKYIVPFVKANIDYKQIAIIQALCLDIVQAAEQLFKHGENDEKLMYASTLLSNTLKKYNIELSPDELRATIEACVVDLKKM